ncbi:GTPase ObgE [bacterium]|nr:GTPase ObgE [bacterium]
MDFIDEIILKVRGGRGGDGCVSFRREKYVAKGGPDGGDGGHGGNVVLKVDRNISTLFDLKHRKLYKAGNGVQGRGQKMHGKRGKEVVIPVPPGTIVFDHESNDFIADLKEPKAEFIIAQGGRGGWGNSHFATPSRQTPDFAKQGNPGEEKVIRMELKLLADAGLVGLPNVGKSTFLSKVSAARPKIANYPFTTLVPNLGIVKYYDYKSFVIADIPGLIRGAHEGKGLGVRFLRHIERTRILIVMISADSDDPEKEYEILVNELNEFGHGLGDKPRIPVITKMDLFNTENFNELPDTLDGKRPLLISSATGEGVSDLIRKIGEEVFKERS